VTINRRARPGDNRDTARCLNDLAQVLRRRGRMDEAEPLYREALEIRRAALGLDHAATAAVREDLAALRASP
jgi:hypothetical protein